MHAFAPAGRTLYGPYRPAQPLTNETVAVSCEWLIVDPACLEPRKGSRPWEASEKRRRLIQQVWGKGAVHEGNLKVGGEPSELAQFAATAEPTMRKEPPAAAALFSKTDEGSPYAQPKEDSEAADRTGRWAGSEHPLSRHAGYHLSPLLKGF